MKSNQTFRSLTATSILLLCVALGCSPPPAKDVAEKEKPKSILGQTTKEVAEWNPKGDQQANELDEVNMVNHVRVGATHAIHEVARLKVQRGLQLFWGSEGRYPKSFDEFMKKVFDVYIKDLPMPTTSCEYQYDVENHELVVVEKKKDE